MNVCLVSNLFPPDIGGPATYVPKIATALCDAGHRVRVVAGTVPGYQALGHEQWPYPVQRVSRGLPLPLRMAAALISTLRAARGADVLYVNGLAGPELAAVLAGRLAGRPVALKIVGDNAWELALRRGWTTDGIDTFQRRRYGPRIGIPRWIVRRYARLASRLIVPSNYLRQVVTGWGVPAERVVVIRNALTTPPSEHVDRTSAREQLDLRPGRIVVTCARLYPWKNLDFLIRLVPDLAPDVTLMIVGDGPERAHLEAVTQQAGVSGRVQFTGSVSQERVQRYLQAADLFALHTRYEGLSHVMLEAMAAGTPIIASDVGGNAEVITSGHNGLLVPLNDRSATLAAIKRLLDDPAEGVRLARAARADAAAYRWDVLVERTISTLADLVGSQESIDG